MNAGKTLAATATLAVVQMAAAQMPQMGGPMKHAMVQFDGVTTLSAHVDMNVPTPIMVDYGDTYMGNFAVLTGKLYNAQYGWIPDGTWAPPAGSSLWIEQLTATPGLEVYRGGMMNNMGAHSVAPIFGTAGSSPRIAWNGTMLHNWYAATMPGDYSATYRLYFGDANGDATPGYTPAEVTFHWTAVPEPAAATLLVVALAAWRRRV